MINNNVILVWHQYNIGIQMYFVKTIFQVFVAFEVVPNFEFSGVAAIPRDADKAIVVIIDDLMDGSMGCSLA